MDQRSDTRPAVQGAVPAHVAADLGRRHREVPLLRHDPFIGPAYAKKLLRAFGENVFDIIEATPDRLREVDGIGARTSRSIM
jgi:ERCC4-type nuclease